MLLVLVLTVVAVGCTPYEVRCQPEVDRADCEPAARAAVAALPQGIGSVVSAEVCSVGVATMCQLHARPTDVALSLSDGSLIGVALERAEDGSIQATAYWDEDGRIDRRP